MDTGMTPETKIALLQKVLDQSKHLNNLDSSEFQPKFQKWKNYVECTLISVFGDQSEQVKQLKKQLKPNINVYRTLPKTKQVSYPGNFRQEIAAKRNFDSILKKLQEYIQQLQQEQKLAQYMQQVFISHASADKDIVEELVEILHAIGLSSEQIFCTSLPGYDIGLGENFLDSIREKLADNTLTLFLLSKNFYDSPFCLCEMGAVWVQTKDHIPIVVPPFDFTDIKGVIPLTQGFEINNNYKLNDFKEKVENMFSLSSTVSSAIWEKKRDQILERINQKIKDAETS